MQAGLAEFFPRHYVVIHGELFMIQLSVAAVPSWQSHAAGRAHHHPVTNLSDWEYIM